METPTVAKPKSGAAKKAAAKPSSAKPTAVTIRGSSEWRDWLEQGAEHCLLDVAKLVDIAVTEYLKGRGFETPRPKR